MKLQYLGDSKDAFKWDYLDFLASNVGAGYLDIIPMKTPPDKSKQGGTSPSRFPTSANVQEFCFHLQKNRNLNEILKLPEYTGKKYSIRLHKPNEEFHDHANFRAEYFSNLTSESKRKRVLFLDPDIGFEPEKTVNEKHVRYSDISTIWQQINELTLVCIFQHSRRIYCPFEEHYSEILCALQFVRPLYSAALYWGNHLMFVLLAKSSDQIRIARAKNRSYKTGRPVKLIDG